MTPRQFIVCTILLAALMASLVDFPKPRVTAPKVSPAARVTSAPSVGQRQPHAPPTPGEVREMTIKQLGNFDYEADKIIPPDVTRLEGMTVRLSGFMIITNESEHIHQFALVPDLFSCCYGQPPAVQHVVLVTCPAGSPCEYSAEPITVEGTLAVKETREEGFVTSIFQLAAHKIAAK